MQEANVGSTIAIFSGGWTPDYLGNYKTADFPDSPSRQIKYWDSKNLSLLDRGFQLLPTGKAYRPVSH